MIRREFNMDSIFQNPISNLPVADMPLKGVNAYLSQGDNHQIIFMEFSEDIDLPEHSHESQEESCWKEELI
jgi:hypothetical protein